MQSGAVFDQSAPPFSRGGEEDAPREPTQQGNRGNRPSAPGGIFGGGVYESDSQFDEQRNMASRNAALGVVEQARPVWKPTLCVQTAPAA